MSILFGVVIIFLQKIPTHNSSSVMFTFNFFIVSGNLRPLVRQSAKRTFYTLKNSPQYFTASHSHLIGQAWLITII